MFRNYFKTAVRNLLRNKSFSIINILGLSLGMACSLLIFLWVQDERNADKSNANKDVYNVYERVFSEGQIDGGPWAPGLLASELKHNIPEIKYATGFMNSPDEQLFTVGDKHISLKGCHADSDFFKIFNYKILEGTKSAALTTPDDIAVSRKIAESFFGSATAAFGKTIRLNNAKVFRISIVFENVQANDSQKFDFVINYKDLLQSTTWLNSWIYRAPFTYIQLYPGADPAKVESKIKNFVTPYLNGADNGIGYRIELGLQRYDEMYLNSTFKNGVPDGGRIEYVRLFSLIAIFILLIACINFMNLATARSVKRAKEVGIRKTVGALRFRLIIQFIGEAVLLTFIAFAVTFLMVTAALPSFNLLTGKQIILPVSSPGFWFGIACLICATGFIAGSYPALFLSSLNPVKVLKGSLKFSPNALLFRKGLVIFQFVISIFMITGTIIISKQIHYVQTKNLGYDKENLIYIPFQGDLINKYEVFKQQLLTQPGIQAVTRSTNPPSKINTYEYDLDWEGKDASKKVVAVHNGIGYDFLKIMNIPVLQGRDFSKSFPTDSNGFIINETALKIIGYKDPIGKPITFFQRRGRIIGVIKDFHLKSLRQPIEPLILFLGEKATWGYTLVKAQPGKTQQAIAGIEQVFKQLEPKFPVRYYFTDEEYQKSYSNELTVSKLSDSFSFLAIFISCLGLLGLTMFTVEQRRKEIGVRKVIGASVRDIVTMISKDIIKLVVLAAIIATPVSWLAMDNWLQNFAYRINISLWIFFFAGVVALLIAILTISYEAVKAALANPVKSLRTE